MESWERRAAKLEKKKARMHVSGRGLLTIVQKASKPAKKRKKRRGR